jgi:hypothetical protein
MPHVWDPHQGLAASEHINNGFRVETAVPGTRPLRLCESGANLSRELNRTKYQRLRQYLPPDDAFSGLGLAAVHLSPDRHGDRSVKSISASGSSPTDPNRNHRARRLGAADWPTFRSSCPFDAGNVRPRRQHAYSSDVGRSQSEASNTNELSISSTDCTRQ